MAKRAWVLGPESPAMSAICRLLLPPATQEELRVMDRIAAGEPELLDAPALWDLDPVSFARVGRIRVDRGNAYQATEPKVLLGLAGKIELVFVECALVAPCGVCAHSSGQLDGETCRECQGTGVFEVKGTHLGHHRPDDPGYGRPPAEFLPASSIGQVISLLAGGNLLPKEWRAVEALDPARRGEFRYIWEAPLSDRQHVLSADGWWHRIPDDMLLAAAADFCLEAALRGECPEVNPDALAAWLAS